MSLLKAAALNTRKLPGILRKCGLSEKFYLSKSSDCSNGLKHLKLKTKLDLYKNVDLLGDAILEWRAVYPLLNAKACSDFERNEMFYTKAENSREKVFENIKLLHATSLSKSSEAKNDQISNMLMEYELLKNSFSEDSLLWNLTFLKFDSTELQASLNEHRFDLCLTINHSIMDDRCLVKLLLKLLNIVELKSLKLNQKYPTQHLLPSINELFYKSTDLNRIDPASLNLPSINIPSFIAPTKRAQNSAQIPNDFVLKSTTNEAEIKPSDLASSMQKNNSKFKLVSFDPELTSSLLHKCKHEKVRLTSFLNMSMLAAFKLLYAKHGSDQSEQNQNISFVNHVSLRPYIAELASYNINELDDFLGYYVNSFHRTPAKQDYDSLKNNFWELVRSDDKSLHDKLDSDDKLIPPLYELVEVDRDKMKHHFELSNIGVIRDGSSAKGAFRIEKNQSMLSFPRTLQTRLLFNIFFTMNGRIQWNICYNSSFVEERYVDEIVEGFRRVLDEVHVHGKPVLDELNVEVDGNVENPNKEICEYFYEMFNGLGQRV